MSIAEYLIKNNDQYLQQFANFSQQEQEKISKLVATHHQALSDFKPFEKAKDINLEESDLMKKVNEALDKAKEQVNNQMNLIIQSTTSG